MLDPDAAHIMAADRNPHVVHPNTDRITADEPFMQNFHPGALDKSHLEKPTLQVAGGNAFGCRLISANSDDLPAESAAALAQRTRAAVIVKVTVRPIDIFKNDYHYREQARPARGLAQRPPLALIRINEAVT